MRILTIINVIYCQDKRLSIIAAVLRNVPISAHTSHTGKCIFIEVKKNSCNFHLFVEESLEYGVLKIKM